MFDLGSARSFLIGNGRSLPGLPSVLCTVSCTPGSLPDLLGSSDMHGRAYGRMTVPNAQVSLFPQNLRSFIVLSGKSSFLVSSRLVCCFRPVNQNVDN
ncbi:hypothetical protein HanIR_Chr01g0039001 [Helianthus annuus]|nr:hypothetical protein HanIR_Chr01g0039001 [Helianthus annuus]